MSRRALLLGTAPLAIVALAVTATAQERAAPSPAPRPPYLQRGDEVEARYQSYRERLQRFFQDLCAQVERGAPDLLAKLRETPPAPVPYGYGILPKLVPNPPRASGAPVVSVSYSWRRTEGFIDRDLGRLEKLETRLRQTDGTAGETPRREWESLVDEYRALAADLKLTANHIDHNRVWQREIAGNRPGYDRSTVLHDAVLEREAYREALRAGDEVLGPSLREQEEALSRQIHDATDKISPPGFLRFEHPSPHRWTVRVRVYTDIEDQAFLEAFRAAVEDTWRVQDGNDDFRVALDIRRAAASHLYPEDHLPARGEHIDLGDHIRRFPGDGAVLTTGAATIYVLGTAIVLGPHDIPPNVLAHEFGHILGFPDGYFRGYRDLGPEGYEILEVVIDRDDIMSAPGEGRVWHYHFERLLKAKAAVR